MERLMIQIPEKKSRLIKSLLKELGVIIEADVFKLAADFNSMVISGENTTMEDIVKETRSARANS